MRWLVIFFILHNARGIQFFSDIQREEIKKPKNKIKHLNYKFCQEVYAKNVCHVINRPSDLSLADDIKFTPGTVFFIDTSCKGSLDGRQACAVESAARANPDRKIVVLFTGPVLRHCPKCKNMRLLVQKYQNIELFRIHIAKYSKGTPLETQLSNIINFSADFLSDVLKFLTLFKFGGIYLDLDVLATRSFGFLPQPDNWVGKESVDTLGSALIAISNDKVGKKIANETLRAFLSDSKSRDMDNKSSSARVLKEILMVSCPTINLKNTASVNCQGFEIYEPKYFYPLSRQNVYQLFKPFPINFPGAFAFHTFSSITNSKNFHKNDLLGQLVQDYCPYIFDLYDSLINFNVEP